MSESKVSHPHEHSARAWITRKLKGVAGKIGGGGGVSPSGQSSGLPANSGTEAEGSIRSSSKKTIPGTR